MAKQPSEVPKATSFKSMINSPSLPEVINLYNDGMCRMKMLAQICLLWMREMGDEGSEEDKKLEHIQESQDLFHQLLSTRENQLQNLKRYHNQQPDPPPKWNPLSGSAGY